ncbi:hypothetical protein AMR72_08590 [Flavobacterium psychrophilum]|nr:hypothetical protein AMR72_08590 [Flavobacterium psychrophilum]AOE52556.1 hypothetical protein ALW18_08580 [Flavobacterium psychrophilum]
MGTVQMVQVTPEELKTMIVDGVKEVLNSIVAYIKPAYEQELWTKKEAANRLKISLSTLNNWLKQGKIESFGIGNRVYIKAEDLEAALLVRKHVEW